MSMETVAMANESAASQVPAVVIYEVDPIPVRIVTEPATGVTTEKLAAAQLSSWQTYIITGLETMPLQILPQDRKRHRAVITVNGTAGDYIIFGKEGQVPNNQGGRMYVGAQIETQSAAAVWVPSGWHATSTNPIIITVQDERYL